MDFSGQISSTAEELNRLRDWANKPVRWIDENPYLVDALRGSVKETGYRDTLTQYFRENPDQLPVAIDRALSRLTGLKQSYSRCRPGRLQVAMGLGTYGWKYDHSIIRQAIKAGITLFDTAESYGYGKVETELGKAIAGQPDLIIATKVARNHLSYDNVRKAAERSLSKLGRIDLYQAHWPRADVRISQTVRAIESLMVEEKIWQLGVSNYSIDQIMAAEQALIVPVQSVQVRYNLIDRGIERALLPWCKSQGIAVLAYSPLGQKFNMLLGAEGGKVLKAIAKANEVTPAQLAVGWVIAKGAIPIPRTNNSDHLVELAEVLDIVLPQAIIEELDIAYPITE